jgi:hypothetical protein
MIISRRFARATHERAESQKDEHMGKSDPEPREMVSRLALSCSALARAGQLLSSVTEPAKTEDAVRQATSILESDARASRLSQMETVARECRSSLEGVSSSERVAVCRKLATKLARLASTLATEVQEQTRKAGKPEPRPAVASAPPAPPSRQPVVPAPASAPSTPRPPLTPAGPSRAPTPRESQPTSKPRPMKPGMDITPIRVAATAEERAAVVAALEDGQRFALVPNGTVIDTRMKLMWAVKAGPAMTHRAAEGYAAECRLGGYNNWRLPQPDELQHFLIGGGRDFGPVMFGSGASPVALWTAETSRRWFFIRQATVVQFETASILVASARRSEVRVLVVRGAVAEAQGMPFG